MTTDRLWLIRDRKTGRYLQSDGGRGPQRKAMVVSDAEKNQLPLSPLAPDDAWEEVDAVMAMQINNLLQIRGSA